MKDLLLKDQDNADIKTFGFHPDETEYHLTVPYKTTGVSFTPTPSTRMVAPGWLAVGMMMTPGAPCFTSAE